MNRLILPVSVITAASTAAMLIGATVPTSTALVGDTTGPREQAVVERPEPVVMPEPEPEYAVGLAFAGDSISSIEPAFANDPGQSWVYSATDNTFPLVGGFAFPGWTTAQVADAIQPATASALVVMIGTNDMVQGVPMEDRLANIDRIISTIPAHDVYISTVAPYNAEPWLSGEWNGVLAQYAADHDYHLIDPWVGVRCGEVWCPGTDFGDGVHPNTSTATYIGQVIRAAIEEEL